MIRLSDLTIDEVFSKEKGDEYLNQLNVIWDELATANMSMFVIKKVIDFPVNLLLRSEQEIFFGLVVSNFLDGIVITINKIIYDEDKKSLTVKNLAEWIRCNCGKKAKQSIERDINNYIGQYPDSSARNSIVYRLRAIRNKLVGHLDKDYALNESKRQQIKIDLPELECLLNQANELFQQLCIGSTKSMLPLTYLSSIQTGDTSESDIDQFLNLVAADSPKLRMPEEQPGFWPVHSETINLKDRAVFNDWRRRIERPEVEFNM